jgi:hypothetical protein
MLTRTQRKVFDAIQSCGAIGVGRDAIMSRVYADHPDGGPEWINVICVHITAINRKIRPLGYKIHATRGPGSVYRLVVLEATS